MFIHKLNQSSWQGAISEAGIGLDFSYSFISQPGATKTILDVHSPYGSFKFDGRKVSLEAAKVLAERSFEIAKKHGTSSKLFGLAITGAHYPDRDSHAWAYLKTTDFEGYIHYIIDQCADRELAGWRSSEILRWFLDACLLNQGSWIKHIDRIPNNGTRIDVLYGPGISDIERLYLLSENNPLVYESGKFHRVVDYVRIHDRICAGSFNPIHKGHLRNASDCMLELSQVTPYKPFVSLEDMLHRIRMIDLCNYPVLITQAPRFLDKHRLLMKLYEREQYTYIVGSDNWNAFVNPLQYADDGKAVMSEMKNARFQIFPRIGSEILENYIARALDHDIMDVTSLDYSSTEIRTGDSNGLTKEVAQYYGGIAQW
jgi:nicotinic acid mononucleotide adenylyltransferase